MIKKINDDMFLEEYYSRDNSYLCYDTLYNYYKNGYIVGYTEDIDDKVKILFEVYDNKELIERYGNKFWSHWNNNTLNTIKDKIKLEEASVTNK